MMTTDVTSMARTRDGRLVVCGHLRVCRDGSGYTGYSRDRTGRARQVFLPRCGQVRVMEDGDVAPA